MGKCPRLLWVEGCVSVCPSSALLNKPLITSRYTYYGQEQVHRGIRVRSCALLFADYRISRGKGRRNTRKNVAGALRCFLCHIIMTAVIIYEYIYIPIYFFFFRKTRWNGESRRTKSQWKDTHSTIWQYNGNS